MGVTLQIEVSVPLFVVPFFFVLEFVLYVNIPFLSLLPPKTPFHIVVLLSLLFLFPVFPPRDVWLPIWFL